MMLSLLYWIETEGKYWSIRIEVPEAKDIEPALYEHFKCRSWNKVNYKLRFWNATDCIDGYLEFVKATLPIYYNKRQTWDILPLPKSIPDPNIQSKCTDLIATVKKPKPIKPTMFYARLRKKGKTVFYEGFDTQEQADIALAIAKETYATLHVKNKSGSTGICFHNKRWTARLRRKNIDVFCKSFATKELALAYYQEQISKLAN